MEAFLHPGVGIQGRIQGWGSEAGIQGWCRSRDLGTDPVVGGARVNAGQGQILG